MMVPTKPLRLCDSQVMTDYRLLTTCENNEVSHLLGQFDKYGGVLEYFVFNCHAEATELGCHRLVAKETIRTAVRRLNDRMVLIYQQQGIIEPPRVWQFDLDAIEQDIPEQLSWDEFLEKSRNVPDEQTYMYAFFNPPYSGMYRELKKPEEKRHYFMKLASKNQEEVFEAKLIPILPACKELFDSLNAKLFCDLEKLTIYRWGTNCSDYFDAGEEWWGTFFWTIYSPQHDWYVGILGSTTD